MYHVKSFDTRLAARLCTSPFSGSTKEVSFSSNSISGAACTNPYPHPPHSNFLQPPAITVSTYLSISSHLTEFY